MQAKTVSVIVTTRNEERNIAECIKAIKAQDYPEENIEIIVVDNNSTDRTKEIAMNFSAKVYNLGPERSAQRNLGVKEASGEYILYLDADMVLSAGVVSECVDECEKGAYIAVYIPEKIKGQGYWIRVRDFERSFYNATPIDCVRFLRRNEFLTIGGFDESLTGPEDWDFDRRLRQIGKAGIVKSPLFHNEGGFNFKRYLDKKKYYAGSFDKYIQKWGRGDAQIKKQLGFWYRYVCVFTESGKWKRLLRHPGLAFGMYLLKFLVGINYLRLKWAA